MAAGIVGPEKAWLFSAGGIPNGITNQDCRQPDAEDGRYFITDQDLSRSAERKQPTMRATQTLFLAASMLAAHALGALAQPIDSTGNQGTNRSVTASPGTADSQAASGMRTGDVNPGSSPYSSTRPMTRGQAANPHQPGATGQTIVPGDSSSAADTAGATRNTQTGGGGGSGNR
jgi:hypothetical protein